MKNILGNYKRILILGSPGAGKTTLAMKISKELNLPLYHMDSLYWLANWQRPHEEDFFCKLENMLNKPCWILDGNYFRYLKTRLNYADAVILLQPPTLLCLWRTLKRFLFRRFNKNSLPSNLKENNQFHFRIAFKLFLNIINFSRKTLPPMVEQIRAANIPIYVISKNQKVNLYAI